MGKEKLTCDLERFCRQCDLLHPIWNSFNFKCTLFMFLDVFEQQRLAHSCVVILVDRSELALFATYLKLDPSVDMSTFSVRTPPVAFT